MNTDTSFTDTHIETPKYMLARLRLLAATGLLAVACGGSTAPTFANTNTDTPAAAAPTVAAADALRSPQTSFADTVARVTPAVVTVSSERRTQASDANPLFDDPRFREFFGERFGQPQQPRRQSGVGSGVIVTADGYILTNNHVVEDAERIRIALTDNREFEAKVIGTDPLSDLAVLKIEARDLPVLPLGNSDQSRIGDIVLAIGNPLGIGQTVTSGIISAKNRASGIGDGSFADFIQTDAPINRGNSGGALVNTAGELIGINSQILSPSGGNIGIGFSIPSNMAKNVMDQLVKTGKVRRSILGVRPQPITSEIAQSLNLNAVRGVLVNEVTPGSGADRAGIRVGDVILKLNGDNVIDPTGFRNRIAGTEPNTEVTLTISRDGREQEVRARLVERPEETASTPGGGGNGGGGNSTRPTPTGALGIDVTPLTAEQTAARGLPQGTTGGLLVRAVAPDGAAAEAGIAEGDVIISANRQPVRTPDDLRTGTERANGRPLLLLINRRAEAPARGAQGEATPAGTNIFVTVTPRTANR